MEDPSDMKLYPTAVVLPLLSFVIIGLCITPLILHAKNRNFPTTCLVCWSIVLNLFNIINAFLWPRDNVDEWWDGTGLCDIEVKVYVAGYIAVPGTLVGMFRGLAIVMDTDRATLVPSKTQRWRNRSVDLLFCVITPAIAMITHIVYQESRYLLYSISGCVNNYDTSYMSLLLAYIWPPIICLIAAYYCCLVIIRLHRYRSDFGVILQSYNSNLNKSRFLRLFFLALTMLAAILPVQGYVLYYDITLGLPWHPYSWDNLHGPAWYKIIKVPAYGQVFFDRWSPIGSGFLIFVFFGFGRDATRIYRRFARFLGLGYCFSSVAGPTDSQGTAPPANASSSTTLVGSISSRAKLIFKGRKASAARNQWNSTLASTSTYNDTEKTNRFSTAHPSLSVTTRKAPWFQSPFRSFRRYPPPPSQDGDVLLDDLSAPSQTICTNAWAGTSENYESGEFTPGLILPERKNFIRVKQVISQQSEVQV
ncbi:hypothetical protein N7510_003190 [Penicillium lagena]|uniref:uncharacterized protein n=1 Tax=Penicillium lagena TaxID=94218 RepID=UPI00254229DA|nr:uncharacterized protein N7510_003190 [Penicillium lagena]KAJ5619206.1 hypothetical protein N7510_003190 [Penicillium lagena]